MAYITINKQKFFNNLDIIAQKTKSKDKIALVLKDNAYGHGLELIASLAKEYGIKNAVVQTLDEAKKIEHLFDFILILAQKNSVAQKNFCFTINTIEDISNFSQNTTVALKVDTGMHRNGIAPDELQKALELIKRNKLKLHSVFSHHRSADELSSEWYWQEENFKKIIQELKDAGFEDITFHIDNSASLFRREEFIYDLARVGIAAYGCLESKFLQDDLQPILSLYAKKIATRVIQKDQKVGYSATFCAKVQTTLSTYDIGYGDGFFRCLSNNYTTPQGIVQAGNISMDNSSFISDKEEIIVFDDARIVAKNAKTIPYEVLTSLKSELPRIIV